MTQGFGNERQILWADYGFLDLSGSEDHGTAGSGVTIVSDSHGNSHKAFDLTGSGGILSTLTQSFGTSDFSIGLWVKTTETARDYLFGADGGGSTSEISSRMHTSRTGSSVTNRVNVYVFADDDTRARIDENSSSIFGGTWKHVVLTRSGGTLELWYDGVKQTPSTYQMTLTGSGEVNPAVPILWGGLNSSGTPTAFPVARLNDMRVFDYKLTDTQIGDWYDNGAGYNLRIPTASVESPTVAQLSVPHGPLIHLASGPGVTDQSVYQRSGISYQGGMGVSGGAYFFDGVDDYADIDTFAGVLSNLAPTSFSGLVWIKTGSDASNRVIWFTTHDSIRQGVYVRLESTGHIKTFFGTNQTSWATTLSTGTVDDDQWHHIVVTWEDGVGGKCYIDGAVDGTTSDTDTLTWTTVTKGALGKDTRTSQTSIFDGYADGLGIYAYTLTPAEITTLYNAERQPNYTHPKFDRPRNILGTVLALRGETGAIDQSDYNQTGVDFEDDAYADDTGFHFDGTGDYVAAPSAVSIYTLLESEVTLSFWLQTTQTAKVFILGTAETGTTEAMTVDINAKANGSGSATEVGSLRMFLRDSGGDYDQWTMGVTELTAAGIDLFDGGLHHITFVLDYAGTPKQYADGVEITVTDRATTGTTWTWDSEVYPLWFGQFNNRGSSGSGLDGTLDDIRIINRTLSAGEIANLAAGGSGDGVAGDAGDTADSVLELRGPTGLTDQSRLRQGDVTAAGDAYVDASGFHFDGTGDYLEAPACGFGITGEGTAAAFVTLDSKPSFAPIIVEGEEGSILAEDFSIQVDYQQSSDRFRAVVFDGNSATVVSANTFGAPTIGEIYHVAAVWTGTNLQIYVNGALSDSTAATTTNTLTGAKTYVGYQNQASERYFDGTIDDIRIIPRALSANEIAELVTPDKFKVLALDPADYSGTGNLLDGSGEGNDATFNGNAAVEGGVLVLDGTGDYLECGDVFGGVTEATFSVWVECDAIGTPDVVIGYRDSTTELLQLTFQTGGVRSQSRRSDNVLVSVTATSPTSGWHHFALTHAAGDNKVYIDGVLVSSDTTSQSGTLTSTKLRIGATDDGAGNEYEFSGSVGKVRLYDAALTSTQIRDLYYEDRPLYQPVGLLGGEVAAWRPDRWVGHGDLLDESGNGNDGTLTEGATVTGDALRCTSSGGHLQFTAVNDSTVTVSMWVRTTADRFAIYCGDIAAGNFIVISEHSVSLGGSKVGTVTPYVDGVAVTDDRLTVRGLVNDGEWHHIAVVASLTSWASTTGYIGKYPFSTDYDRDAEVDDPRIFNRTLDPAEIKALASARPFDTPNTLGSSLFLSPSTQHAWGSGEDVAVDLSGEANNGTLTNMDAATDWVEDTDSDGVAALDFDGSDDRVEVGESFFQAGYTALTWASVEDTASTAHWLITDSTNITSNGFTLAVDDNLATAGQGNAYVRGSNRFGSGLLGTGWAAFALRIDTAASIDAWLNGVQELSPVAVTVTAAGGVTTFGGSTTFAAEHLKGRMDTMVIYTRPLTDEQIALWAQSRSPFADPIVSSQLILPRRRQIILPGGTL